MQIKDVKFIKSIVEFEKDINPLNLEKDKKKIFFLGRSNVGKSSLINSLLDKYELAYSGAKAGKTRTINIFEVNKKIECMDFPGYGFAVGGKENQVILRDMILNYLESNLHNNLKAILIIDAFVGPTALDEEIFDYISEKGVEILLVLNKVDKTKQGELEKTLKKVFTSFGAQKYILYSCKTGKHRDSALDEIFG